MVTQSAGIPQVACPHCQAPVDWYAPGCFGCRKPIGWPPPTTPQQAELAQAAKARFQERLAREQAARASTSQAPTLTPSSVPREVSNPGVPSPTASQPSSSLNPTLSNPGFPRPPSIPGVPAQGGTPWDGNNSNPGYSYPPSSPPPTPPQTTMPPPPPADQSLVDHGRFDDVPLDAYGAGQIEGLDQGRFDYVAMPAGGDAAGAEVEYTQLSERHAPVPPAAPSGLEVEATRFEPVNPQVSADVEVDHGRFDNQAQPVQVVTDPGMMLETTSLEGNEPVRNRAPTVGHVDPDHHDRRICGDCGVVSMRETCPACGAVTRPY